MTDFDKLINASDLIGWIMEAYPDWCEGDIRVIVDHIDQLPPAQPHWIPCSERLPEENVPVLLGVRFKDDFKFIVSARHDYNYWSWLGRDIIGELRWMPLPEPYRADRRGENDE